MRIGRSPGRRARFVESGGGIVTRSAAPKTKTGTARRASADARFVELDRADEAAGQFVPVAAGRVVVIKPDILKRHSQESTLVHGR